MKSFRPLIVFLSLFAAFSLLAPRAARAEVSFDFFYGSLSPRGAWVRVSDYGYCWHPSGVSEGWRPYTDGYWAYTDAGWTWVSYEDWGGITYHYGRWTLVDGYGWVWVPGYHWGPAWVSWRRSDDYIGWAPLPPECHYHPGVTIGFSVDTAYGIGPRWYNFCAFHDFGAPALGAVVIDPDRNVGIIDATVNITNITSSDGLVRNGGPSFDFVSRRSARPIQRLALVRSVSATPFKSGFQSVRGGKLQVVAPTISPSAGSKAPSVAHVFSKPVINHGWTGIPSGTKQSLRTQFSQEKGAKSLATIPKGTAVAPLALKKSVSTNPALEPFKPATAQTTKKIEATKKVEPTRKEEHFKTEGGPPKTVAVKPAVAQPYHAPKPQGTPKPEVVDRTLKLKTPPAMPKVSTAGGKKENKDDDKKDKKKDSQGQ